MVIAIKITIKLRLVKLYSTTITLKYRPLRRYFLNFFLYPSMLFYTCILAMPLKTGSVCPSPSYPLPRSILISHSCYIYHCCKLPTNCLPRLHPIAFPFKPPSFCRSIQPLPQVFAIIVALEPYFLYNSSQVSTMV